MTLATSRKRKSKYRKDRASANALVRETEKVERATRLAVASDSEIAEWIEQELITEEEADLAFAGYAETSRRRRGMSADQICETDYNLILEAYRQYSLGRGKGGPNRESLKSHRNSMSLAGQVVSWLSSEFPNVTELDVDDTRAYLRRLSDSGYSRWSIHHFHTKLRLLLDRACDLKMLTENPARSIRMSQPKRSKERVILCEAEAKSLLDASLLHRGYISGGLPTVVRLGLYAGLRDEEMCWLRWEAIDWRNRIISIRESHCEETNRSWIPKDHEARRLDVKESCIHYLKDERKRQRKLGILGPFILPGGHWKQPQYRCRPLSQEAPQKAFARMIRAEGLKSEITIYSLRHTYATMALRHGVDLRTLQQRMGHANLKTTMEYLHHIEPERHPMDILPY